MATKEPRLGDWYSLRYEASGIRNLMGKTRIPDFFKPIAQEYDSIMERWKRAIVADLGELDAEDIDHLNMRTTMGPNMLALFKDLSAWLEQRQAPLT